ncbi:MAG: lamin tail domain-containing protein [Verrucomicrobiota bacterium]
MKQKILTTLFAAAIFSAHAQLAITEVMTQDANNARPDWWEVTNFGTNNVDLTGYSWNDDAHGGFAGTHNQAAFAGVIVHPGESVVFTEQKGTVTDAASFRAWWGISPAVQVIALPANDNGLGLGGDSVRLWSTNVDGIGTDTNGLDLNQLPEFLVDRVDTTAGIAGRSLTFNTNSGLFGISSTNGVNGAFVAALTADVGSPGYASTNNGPLVIASQPTNLLVNVGIPAVFQVRAYGLPKPRVQWLFNGVPVDTNNARAVFSVVNNFAVSTLTINSAQVTNAGTFRAVVSNGLQTVVSSNATLSVNTAPVAPAFTQTPPTGLFAYPGQSPTLTAAVFANPPAAFQWQFNGVSISGATDAQLVLPVSDTNQSGVYSLVATNIAGTNQINVQLTVTARPELRITEVMTSENVGGSHNDWWELSNLGDFAVNLQGFRFDDNSAFTGIVPFSQSFTITNAVVIAPGESIVLVEDMTADEFRTWWGAEQLPPNLQVVTYHGSGLSLSGTLGDALTLWNAAANQEADFIDSVSVATQTNGVSFGFDPYARNFPGTNPDGLSVAGVNGAVAAAVNGDLGSPGTIISFPRFTGAAPVDGGLRLSFVTQSNYSYAVQCRTNLDDTAWTTITNVIATGGTLDWTDSSKAGQRFYRLLVKP